MIERIVRALNTTLAAGSLVLLMLLITFDVGGRYFLNRPIPGSLEMGEVGLVIVVFISLSYTAILKGHIRIDMFTSRMPPQWQAVADVVNNLLGIGIFSLIAWQGWVSALHAKAVGITSDLLKFPIYPFKLFVPLGSILLCLVLVTDIVQSLRKVGKGAK